MKKIFFTREGFERLNNEINNLEKSKPYLINELKKASELGDRSENAAYRVAKSKLRQVEGMLNYLNKLKISGKIAVPNSIEKVSIGCQVILKVGNSVKSYIIVGSQEANPLIGQLSYLSPLGSLLLNKKAGDFVKLHVPSGTFNYKILEIKIPS